ncbi:MAG: NAD-dependent epimerase/dehydratase family protein [Acidiferrobacterales bacterium]|nr:NAD-dependent epimerase/dehydratase family protein [Acidiferrobacterales bacterium]
MNRTDISQSVSSPVVIAGCGYTGTRIAANSVSDGTTVIALTASTRVPVQGVESLQCDLDLPQSKDVSAGDGACVIYLVPPPPEGTKDTRIRNFLSNTLAEVPRKFVLISTTGVYGDARGDWVCEDDPVNPQTDRARRRLDSELVVTDWARQNSVDVVILRVGAIYGPGRVPVERLRRGVTLPPAGSSGFLNRVHVDDLTDVCMAAMSSDAEGIFNVTDGQPLRMIEYMNLVAEIFDLPRVIESSSPSVPELHSNSLRQYLSESRKVNNSRMLDELSVNLRYPTARQGLEASFREMTRSGQLHQD